MDDWKEVTLADIADIVPGFAFKGSDFGTVGQSVIKIKDIVPPIIDILHTNKIDIKKYNKHKIDKYKIKKNDFVVAMTGATIGKVGILTREIEAYVNQRVAIIKPHDNMSKEFVYYTTQITEFYNHIKNNIDSNSAQENISGNSIGKYIIYIPSLDYQNRIVDILSPLDHKIELNRQMNETLEQMAQAVFQDWFVDFGPVKRKAKGITDPVAILGGLIPNPAQAQKIASLFPDQFAEDGLPLGSKIIKLQDILELAYGKSLPQKRRVKGSIPVYGSGGITGYHNECLIDGPSIIIGRKGSIGTIYWENSPSFPIDTVFYVKSEFPLIYLYFLLKQFDLKAMNTDAAVPGLNRNNVYRLQIPYLNKTVIEKYASLMTPLFSYCRSNLDQNHTLAEMRDLLLPKLMSGEISVDELEKKMGGVL